MSTIIVTGLPRSGSSMMMAMLEAGGIECIYDKTQPADEFNALGYYESRDAMAGNMEFLVDSDNKAIKLLSMVNRIPEETDAKYIIMRRDIDEIAKSATQMRQARGTLEEAPILTSALQEEIDAERLKIANKPHIEVWYNDILRNAMNECLRIQRLLGRGLNLSAMTLIPNNSLNHMGNRV